MLTWSCYAPAPYESAFSILNKLRLVNAATLEEIGPPLGLTPWAGDGSDGKPVKRLQRSAALWDLPRAARATGTPARWLRQGLLQDLWFPLVVKQRDGVRFCRQCSALGYHNSFFDLAAMPTAGGTACRLGRHAWCAWGCWGVGRAHCLTS